MSFFKKIFSSEKKETLDKGLEKSKSTFFNKLNKAVAGKSKVDDDVLDNLEEILVPESLVSYYSEHSERHYLPRLAAALGVSREDRDYIGNETWLCDVGAPRAPSPHRSRPYEFNEKRVRVI